MKNTDTPKVTNRLPVDPHAFLVEAQRITNERDIDAISTVFAPDAVWVSTLDGVVITARGLGEIDARWRLMCRFMQARKMIVHKELIAVDDHTLVSRWEGTLAGGTAAHGIEVWKFDQNGLVIDQHTDGFLNTAPDTSALQSLRMLLSYPVSATTFGWLRLTAELRHRRAARPPTS